MPDLQDLLMNVGVITGTLSAEGGLQGALSMPQERDTPAYEGEYSVVPQAYDAQVLPTMGYKMLDDVIVTEIPYYETSNDKGGYTAIIGG